MNLKAGASQTPLVVVTGLAVEARVAGAGDFATVIGAGRAARLSAELEAALAGKAAHILSFGVAGGLSPQLRPGDLVLAHGLRDGAGRLSCDPGWRAAMLRRLQGVASARAHDAASPPGDAGAFRRASDGRWRPALDAGEWPTVDIVGVDAPVADAAAKAALFVSSGAAAVDMESAIVARFAQRHRIPFAAVRVIADPADRFLPSSALKALGPEGAIDLGGLFAALIADPGQIFALVRLAADARKAISALARARDALGADFASQETEGLHPG
jgi:adenosylhomocysteine nucleosidase